MAATAGAPISAPGDERHEPATIQARLHARIGEPAANDHWVVWNRRVENVGVRAEPPSVNGAGAEHEDPRDQPGAPAETLTDDLGCEPNLLIHLPQCGLGGQQLGLDLEHDEGARFRAPTDNIERSALSILRVGHLGPNGPSELFQPPGSFSAESSVVFVDQSIRLAAPPSDFES